MENQKIINLLNKDDIDSKHFATKKWRKKIKCKSCSTIKIFK